VDIDAFPMYSYAYKGSLICLSLYLNVKLVFEVYINGKPHRRRWRKGL
jgi:hypothetical protein